MGVGCGYVCMRLAMLTAGILFLCAWLLDSKCVLFLLICCQIRTGCTQELDGATTPNIVPASQLACSIICNRLGRVKLPHVRSCLNTSAFVSALCSFAQGSSSW